MTIKEMKNLLNEQLKEIENKIEDKTISLTSQAMLYGMKTEIEILLRRIKEKK